MTLCSDQDLTLLLVVVHVSLFALAAHFHLLRNAAELIVDSIFRHQSVPFSVILWPAELKDFMSNDTSLQWNLFGCRFLVFGAQV